MARVFAVHRVDHMLEDIGGVVADALERFGDEQDVEAARGEAFDGIGQLELDPSPHARNKQARAIEQLVELARRVRLVHAAKVSGAT